ncbi:MAG TPA: hypothetical protein VMD79_08375 [Solirubrobacteraceae bacterium]|nr:hypothetical protein [Solirubrobacteraceae bacterium]
MAGAPPIPPPHVSRGAAAGALPGYVPPRGERSAPRWRIPGGANNRKRIAALAAAAALALALVLLLAGVFKSGSHVTDIQAPPTARAAAQAQAGLRQPGVASVSGQAPFVVHYPSDWTRLTSAQLARIANPPAAGLIAEGGKVLLFVRPEKPLTQPLSTLAVQLTESLRRRFADFKLLSTGTTRTLAGPAWVYTFARTAHQLVQSEVVISTPSAAYELDITLRGSADRAARQMGEIVHSFQA